MSQAQKASSETKNLVSKHYSSVTLVNLGKKIDWIDFGDLCSLDSFCNEDTKQISNMQEAKSMKEGISHIGGLLRSIIKHSRCYLIAFSSSFLSCADGKCLVDNLQDITKFNDGSSI